MSSNEFGVMNFGDMYQAVCKGARERGEQRNEWGLYPSQVACLQAYYGGFNVNNDNNYQRLRR